MQKEPQHKLKTWVKVLLTIGIIFITLFVIIPLLFALFDGSQYGNVALIKVNGIITEDGGSSFGESSVSSSMLVNFINDAEQDSQIKAILVEINSPGGSPVASDEIGTALKNSTKPTVALIREVGASGGYWIASATDHIIANRMSITGSIGVQSSYLQFSGLMEKYGIKYEQIIAGENKDLGNPYLPATPEQRNLLQQKADKIREYFIEEVANNRNLPKDKVETLATGEFYLGSEALQLGLIDELGDKKTAEAYLKQKYALEDIDYVVYEPEPNLFQMLSQVLNDFSFQVGRGFGSMLTEQQNNLMLR
jgi:protease-4